MDRMTKISYNIGQKPWRFLLATACCLVLPLAWVACSPAISGFNLNDDSTVITVVPDGSTIDVGQQLQFTVQLTKKGETTNADPTLFNWVSSGPSVATVDNHGVALGIHSGSVVIRAQSKSQSSNAGSASLTVQTAPAAATLAAMPQAILVRFSAGDREVSYAADGSRGRLRTTITYADGSSRQRETSVSGGAGPYWIALDHSGSALYLLSRTSRQVARFAIDSVTGEVVEQPTRFRVDEDVFAIAAGDKGEIELVHLNGRVGRLKTAGTD